MSINVSCHCGQRFNAPDALAGKRVKCPQCSSAIQIPTSGQPASSTAPSRPQGNSPAAADDFFDVEETEANQQHDPLGLGGQSPAVASTPGVAPQPHGGMHTSPYARQAAASSGHPRGLLIGVAVGGGALVVFVIVAAIVGVFVLSGSDQSELSENENGKDRPTSSVNRVGQPRNNSKVTGVRRGTSVPTVSSDRDIPGASASDVDATDNDDSNPTPDASDAVLETKPAETKSAKTLARAAPNWVFDMNAQRAGTRKVKDKKLVILYYSWMVELLPSLGYQEVYDRFDFEKSWTEPENQRVCHELIPQFLNPLDDRQRLDDPRFPAFAVTHFAGMSGVENLPNDRAAEWARAHPSAGVFGYHDMARITDITDGTSNTIMIVGTGRIVQPWAIGGGATVRGAREPLFGKYNGIGSVGLPKPGVIVVMADGSIRHISSDIDPEVFKALCTIHGAEPIDLKTTGISQVQEDWFRP